MFQVGVSNLQLQLKQAGCYLGEGTAHKYTIIVHTVEFNSAVPGWGPCDVVAAIESWRIIVRVVGRVQDPFWCFQPDVTSSALKSAWNPISLHINAKAFYSVVMYVIAQLAEKSKALQFWVRGLASYYSARICWHIATDASTAASRYGINEGLKQQQLCSALALQVLLGEASLKTVKTCYW
jgi:hypothetical protein